MRVRRLAHESVAWADAKFKTADDAKERKDIQFPGTKLPIAASRRNSEGRICAGHEYCIPTCEGSIICLE